MDFHKELGTSVAVEYALDGKKVDGFLRDHKGIDLVHICENDGISTDELIKKLTKKKNFSLEVRK